MDGMNDAEEHRARITALTEKIEALRRERDHWKREYEGCQRALQSRISRDVAASQPQT